MSDTVLVSASEGVATVTLNRPDALNSLHRRAQGERCWRRCCRSPRTRPPGRWCSPAPAAASAPARTCASTATRWPAATAAPLSTVAAALQPDLPGAGDDAQAGHRRGQRHRRRRRGLAELRLRLPDRGRQREVPARVRQRRAGPGHRRVLDAAAADRARPGDRAGDPGRAGRRVRGAGDGPGQRRGAGRRAGRRPRSSWPPGWPPGPTAAYAAIKEQLLYSAAHPLAAALEREGELQNALGTSPDHREATAAFLRKEKPIFHGR